MDLLKIYGWTLTTKLIILTQILEVPNQKRFDWFQIKLKTPLIDGREMWPDVLPNNFQRIDLPSQNAPAWICIAIHFLTAGMHAILFWLVPNWLGMQILQFFSWYHFTKYFPTWMGICIHFWFASCISFHCGQISYSNWLLFTMAAMSSSSPVMCYGCNSHLSYIYLLIQMIRIMINLWTHQTERTINKSQ